MLAGIASISANPADGNLQIKMITVPNSAGFQNTNLFHLSEIEVAFDPGSLYGGQLCINRVLIDSPLLNLEQTETRGNVSELQRSLMAFVPDSPEAPDPESMSGSDDTDSEQAVALADQPVILELLEITNLAVYATLPQPESSTNTTSTGPLDRMTAGSLNPLSYMAPESTNRTRSARSELPPLLAFEGLKCLVIITTIGIVLMKSL